MLGRIGFVVKTTILMQNEVRHENDGFICDV